MEPLIVVGVLGILFSGVVALVLVLSARGRIGELDQRLRALELRAPRTAAPSPPAQPAASDAAAAPVATATLGAPVAPVAPRAPVAPSPPTSAGPSATVPWLRPELLRPRGETFVPLRRHDLQAPIDRATAWLLGHWLLVAGAIVLQLGIAFGVKYSFEQGWISERVRIGGGCVIGLLLCAGSFAPRVARIRPLAEALFAAGLASLYFCGFASYHFYRLVPMPAALAFVALVAAVSAAVAALRDQPLTAHLALFGAYVAPLLFKSSVDQQPALFAYLFAVTCGALLLAVKRPWPAIPGLAALATAVVAKLWFDRFFAAEKLDRSLLLHALVLAPLLAMPLLRALRGRAGGGDLLAAAFTALFAGLAIAGHCAWRAPSVRGAAAVGEQHWVLAGHLFFGLAVLHGGFALLLRRAAPRQGALRRLYAAIACALFPAAAAGWFDGNPVTLLLGAECVALAAIAARQSAPLAWIGSFVIGAIAAGRISYGLPRIAAGAPFGDHVTLLSSSLAAVALLYVAQELLRRAPRPAAGASAKPDWIDETTGPFAAVVPEIGEVGNAALLAVVMLRFLKAAQERFAIAADLHLAECALALAAIGGGLALWAARSGGAVVRRVTGGIIALGALGVLVRVATLIADVTAPRWPLCNAPLLLAAATLLLVVGARRCLDAAAIVQSDLRRVLALGELLLPLALLCAEWQRLVREQGWSDQRGSAGISILIGLYATALLALAAGRRSRAVRIVALVLYGVLLFKMVAFDLAAMETLWRVVSFVIVGALLLVAWLLLRDRTKDAGPTPPSSPPPVTPPKPS